MQDLLATAASRKTTQDVSGHNIFPFGTNYFSLADFELSTGLT